MFHKQSFVVDQMEEKKLFKLVESLKTSAFGLKA